jgi:hypothetical protein
MLLNKGHHVISPADMDREFGFEPADLPSDWDWHQTPPSFDANAAIDRDIAGVRRADGIYFLDGWQSSKGARAEHAIAVWCGKPVYCEWDLPPRCERAKA